MRKLAVVVGKQSQHDGGYNRMRSGSRMITAYTRPRATHEEGYFRALQESCKRHRMPLTVLGWGQPWRGFNWRFRLMQEALATRPPDLVVMLLF